MYMAIMGRTRSRAVWISLCTHEEGMLEVLAAVPNETAVPLTELGHSVDVDENADKPAWFYLS
jgi:hypothetical protein